MGEDISLDDVKEHAERLSQTARPWIKPLARFGYAAKGVVYVIIGVLSAAAALSGDNRTTDSRGALREILHHTFGDLLLGIVAVGLWGYALWRFVQAIKDTEDKGTDLKGIAIRTSYACIGCVYVGLGYSAVQLLLGNGAGRSSDESSKEWTATLLALPFGRWLVGLAGLCVIAFAAFQCYKAYAAKFRRNLKTEEMTAHSQTLTTRAGQVGLTARAIVFAIIGIFLIQAALRARASDARGLSGALHSLAEQPYGPWILGVVALGLVVYGLHMFVQAFYRRLII